MLLIDCEDFNKMNEKGKKNQTPRPQIFLSLSQTMWLLVQILICITY